MKKSLLSLLMLVSLCLSLCAPALAAGDSIYDAEAASFGSTYNGSISATNKVDYYSLTLPSSGRITLNATAGMKYIYYYLYDGNGTQMWKINPSWNATSQIIATSQSFDLTKGTYYFAISQDGSNTGNYSFSFDFSSANETYEETGSGTNNDPNSANSMSLGSTYQGHISINDDRDFYKFTLPSSGQIVINASAKMQYIYYTLYNESSAQVWRINPSWNSVSGQITTAEYIDLVGGTYYLAVSRDGSRTGEYSVSVSFTSADESFAETIANEDNTIQTANTISLDSLYKGQLALNDGKDFYTFTLTEAEELQFTATANRMQYIYYIIYDYAGNQIWKKNPGWNSTTKQIVTSEKLSLSEGTYYLAVSQDGSRTGTYEFCLVSAASGGPVVDPGNGNTPVSVTGVALSQSSLSLSKGSSTSLTATVSPANADNKSVTWTSSSPQTAKVDANGRVTAVAAGTAVITVTTSDGSYTATCRVSVTEADKKVTGVTVSKTSLTMEAGQTQTLTAAVAPTDAKNRAVTWSSSNAAVASVNSNGRVTALSAGAAEITVKTTDGGFTASCRVIVKGETKPTGTAVHFPRANVYHQGQFIDVKANQWYTASVAEAFELGLMKGTSATTFDINGSVTVAEAITMAARIHCIYTSGSDTIVPQKGEPWYQAYLDYAYQNKVISDAYYNSDVMQVATRAQFAEIFANSLPEEALSPINNIADGKIPDVPMSANYASAVYKLYRAGILAGGDATGTFSPFSYISRVEAAAIVSRMAESNSRRTFSL